jgi:integrase
VAGIAPADSGSVRFDGVDLYGNLSTFRSVLGYVPQDDIIHADLPLERTLRYAARLRQLVALTLGDLDDKPAGLMLHIRRSKTDPEGHGAVVGVAHGQHAATDPVAALNAWREIRGAAPGPVFTRIWGSTVSLQPLTGHVPARMLRARAEAAGLDGTRITAHSMRAGHATTAALAGVPLDRIAAQTRHKDLSVLVNRYIRPLEALATTSSKDLGL